MSYPKVIIVILNWNGKNDTIECLESVRQVDYPNFDVLVVDNGSTDDSVEAIRSKYSEVTILETGENFGYAEGNNVGIRYALRKGADYIFILNNDTIVDSQIVNNFIQASTSCQQGGIFAAKIYYFSQPNKIQYAGAKWVSNLHHFIHVGFKCIDNGKDFNSIAETDYACGCALFSRAEVFQRIGLFDEKFFLIFEETDLCYRARKAGFKSYFVPEAKVWHKISASLGGDDSVLFTYFYIRNLLLWAEKHLSFYERFMLYMKLLYRVIRHYLPPRFHIKKLENKSLLRRIFLSSIEYGDLFLQKYNNPIKKSRLLGMRDYILRRFGNCPEIIISLGKQDHN